MEEKLLKIINHFGVDNQQRKLEEEVFELQEAITRYECGVHLGYLDYEAQDKKALKHIEEEIGDVLNVIEQFIAYYDLDKDKILNSQEFKINRTLKEIENE